MAQFDANKDGKLQRDELRNLLAFLHPSRPPTEENLDYLVERATAIESHSMRIPGKKNGAVGWHDLRQVVSWYGDYVKDQLYIDSIYSRFDSDNSGSLERSEIGALLRSVAPEDCVVDDADVEYILENFDTDQDGVIGRDELLPMLAKWAQVAYTKVEQQQAEERRRNVAAHWRDFRGAVTQVGEAAASTQVGGKIANLVAAARQQQKKEVAISRWHVAAEKGSPQKSKGPRALLDLVAAARAQKSVEDLAAAAAPSSAASSTTEEDGRSTPGDGSDEAAPALAATKALSVVELSPEMLEIMTRTHSRSSSLSVGDRDGPWHKSDHDLARRLSRASKRAIAANAFALHGPSATRTTLLAGPSVESVREESDAALPIAEEAALPEKAQAARGASPRKVQQVKPEGVPARGSSMCVIQ